MPCLPACRAPLQVRKKRYTKLQEERAYWSSKKKKAGGKKAGGEHRAKPHHRPKH